MSADDYARGFAAGIEEAARIVQGAFIKLESGEVLSSDVKALMALGIRALAASTVTVDTGTGPYEAQVGVERMPVPESDASTEAQELRERRRARVGDGRMPVPQPDVCQRCCGETTIIDYSQSSTRLVSVRCPICSGTGKVKP